MEGSPKFIPEEEVSTAEQQERLPFDSRRALVFGGALLASIGALESNAQGATLEDSSRSNVESSHSNPFHYSLEKMQALQVDLEAIHDIIGDFHSMFGGATLSVDDIIAGMSGADLRKSMDASMAPLLAIDAWAKKTYKNIQDLSGIEQTHAAQEFANNIQTIEAHVSNFTGEGGEGVKKLIDPYQVEVEKYLSSAAPAI